MSELHHNARDLQCYRHICRTQ